MANQGCLAKAFLRKGVQAITDLRILRRQINMPIGIITWVRIP
jgi:hypothetical protein